MRAPWRWLVVAAVVFAASGARAESPPPAPDEGAEAPAPRLVIKGFGNVNFRHESDEAGQETFSLGELDMFVTSELSDDLSFLTEIVFEPSDDEVWRVEVERYQIEYSRSDLLNVSLGRMHTMLGHWNHAYHHGVWFQTTAFRPELYEFEHSGGVLPVHELGLRLAGRRTVTRGRFEYSVTVSNGRGPVARRLANLSDMDRSKAVNLWLALAPASPSGLKAGVVVRFDRIPSSAADPGRDVALSERILGGFITYQRAKTELLGEAILIRHRERSASARDYRTSGFYVQASHRWGRFTPYYRFEGLDRAPDDPYYSRSDDLRRHVGGLRIDPWPWAGVKLELNRDALDPGPDSTGATVQVAFTF